MVRQLEPGPRSCVELVATAFGDTIFDVAHLDGRKVPPGSADLARVWAREMDEVQHARLENGETVWLEHRGVRFRARLVPREAVRVSTRTADRPFLASLAANAVFVLTFLMLLRAQPEPLIDEDHRHAVLAKLLELEPVPTEPIPRLRTETANSVETTLAHPAPPPRDISPRWPESYQRTSKRERPRWAPAGPAQAIGQLGRNHDPIEAARHAGIFGVLGDRRLDHERVFDPDVDDAQLWAATTSEIVPIGPGTFGDFSYTMAAEGVIGWGSYGSMHVGNWRDRVEEHPASAFCSGDCRVRAQPPRPTIVRIGRVDVQGAMERDVARRIVRAHVNELRRCFNETITERTTELEGDIEFFLTEGKVGSIVMGPAFSNDLAGCTKRAIRTWRFPVRSSHDTSLVSVSLHFSR